MINSDGSSRLSWPTAAAAGKDLPDDDDEDVVGLELKLLLCIGNISFSWAGCRLSGSWWVMNAGE